MALDFAIAPRGPYSLELAAGFGFGPRLAEQQEPIMRLAFAVDGLREHAGVVIRQDRDGGIYGEAEGVGDEGSANVRGQVARILSLDHDGAAWMRVGERDSVIARLQALYPGLRPVLFHSPYEAAGWALISARQRREQAIQVRERIAARLGRGFELAGRRLHAFPLPGALAALRSERGLSSTKAGRLRSLAERARAGELEAERLRAMGADLATAELQTLEGIGPFYASLIVVRACGFTDVLAREPALGKCVGHFYGLDQPPRGEEFEALAERWRPFRTWSCVLLRYAGTRAGLVAP
jgi:DNA-3-methyladenine glycosylase II